MSTGGNVFVLDLGNPIRIQDLAKRMIQLAGLTVRDDANPDGDIEICYTGLRPAEKLYKELLIGDNVKPTGHLSIMHANENYIGYDRLSELLDELDSILRNQNRHSVREILIRVIEGYLPDNGIDGVLWNRATLGEKVPRYGKDELGVLTALSNA